MTLWDNLHYVKPFFPLQCMFSPSHKHRLLVKTLQHCSVELQMWPKWTLKEQIGAFSIQPPSQPKLPLHKYVSRKPAVGLGRREEVTFYIKAVNHSSMLCIFPRVVWLPGWLAGWLSGWQGAWGGMCCGAGPSAEGLTGRLVQGVARLLRGPRGAYLNQSPVWTIALKHSYCIAAAWDKKAGTCKKGEGREGVWKRKTELSWKGGEAGWEKGERRSGQCHPSFTGNGTISKNERAPWSRGGNSKGRSHN